MNSTALNICLNFAQSLFPQNCYLCGALAGLYPVCADCRADLTLHSTAACPICAYPTAQGEICGQCLRRPPAYQRTLAGYRYEFPTNKLIHGLKYQHQFALVDTLIAPLLESAQATPSPDALLAMPLHPQRLRERGYNQAQLLAAALSRQLHIPLLTLAAERSRNTRPQTGLPLTERHANIKNAFTTDAQQVTGKHIAIIDDVMTSGSTLNSLAHSLKSAGASEVSCWVVTRAVLK
ncbi:ComF family protein [Sulfuriferula nivalis]|uniref:Amidophosphoribosyltransferase n=1 Tax=Sulfuriferula nivalis TaxID=2675298 RepID=A0A809RKR6_9PROT|nr:ComF family protein [Sulfuriferula nivalis]BBP02055.1 amidophosphoribosyltransferase [Sulfuriferula nivalis]